MVSVGKEDSSAAEQGLILKWSCTIVNATHPAISPVMKPL